MRKNIILASIAVMAIASSCSQEEEVTNPGTTLRDADLITFRASTTNATRGMILYNNSNLADFAVTATTAGDVSQFYITDSKVSKSGNIWTPSEQYYWPAAGELDFYAVAPSTISLSSGPLEEYLPGFYNEDIMYFDYKVKVNAKDQEDIIFAVSKGETKSSNAVNLSFNHAMSHVSFKAKLKENANLKVVISDVQMCNIIDAGRFVLVEDEWVQQYCPFEADSPWLVDVQSKSNFSIGLTSPVTVDSSEAVELYDKASGDDPSDGTLFMIPTHSNQPWTAKSGSPKNSDNCYLRIKCSIYQEGQGYLWPTGVDTNAENVETKWVVIPFQGWWDMATNYTYTLVFGEGAGYDEEGTFVSGKEPDQVIVPISFNVSSVSDFVAADEEEEVEP